MINAAEVPKFGLFDMDCSTVESFGPVVCVDRGGFLYCTQGHIDLAQGDHAYKIQPGNIYLYPPLSHTYIHQVSSDLKCVVGVSELDFIFPIINLVSNSQNQIFILENPCVALDQAQRLRIEELIAIFRHRENEKVEYVAAARSQIIYTQLLSALGQALCYEIMQAYFSNKPIQPLTQKREDRIFLHFLFSLRQNFKNHHDVAFYAAEQCLTPRYFSTIIRLKTGRTALQWITATIIAEARKLLADPNPSIKEIADRLGFPNQSFFGRYFKQYAGLSPSDFRISNHK